MIEALALFLLLLDPATFRSDVTLVTVPCVVTGDRVPVLKLEDFHLYADGVSPQKIQNFLWT